nr:hypothetical protein [bacterium]
MQKPMAKHRKCIPPKDKRLKAAAISLFSFISALRRHCLPRPSPSPAASAVDAAKRALAPHYYAPMNTLANFSKRRFKRQARRRLIKAIVVRFFFHADKLFFPFLCYTGYSKMPKAGRIHHAMEGMLCILFLMPSDPAG